jgi:hypothetical protein
MKLPGKFSGNLAQPSAAVKKDADENNKLLAGRTLLG